MWILQAQCTSMAKKKNIYLKMVSYTCCNIVVKNPKILQYVPINCALALESANLSQIFMPERCRYFHLHLHCMFIYDGYPLERHHVPGRISGLICVSTTIISFTSIGPLCFRNVRTSRCVLYFWSLSNLWEYPTWSSCPVYKYVLAEGINL